MPSGYRRGVAEEHDGPSRALLVIDVQNEYVDGALPIAYPPLATSLPNIAAATAAANAAHVPVVLVRHEEAAGSPVFAAGSLGSALHRTVVDADHELLLVKDTVSCFASTPLATWLADRGVGTLTIAGFMTQHCVASTTRDAADLGLAVEVLADATGAPPLSTPVGDAAARDVHEGTLLVLASGFASIATTADWVDAVRSGRPLPPPDLWTSTEPARSGTAGD